MSQFVEEQPSVESCFRSVVLFGRNSASYKLSLAKSLIELASAGLTTIRLDELAVPFARHITEHLKASDRQGTSGSSRFLDACRRFNEGTVTHDELIQSTVQLGFTNVLDAFHVVNQGEIPTRFFEVGSAKTKSIVLTDDLLGLKESCQFGNFAHETEARWRLVETAWNVAVSTRVLEIQHDRELSALFVDDLHNRRVSITSCRDALNGYQKGKCFYCFANVSVEPDSDDLVDVDHVIPHILAPYMPGVNLDGVWNLVLSCQECNRGVAGKFARIPAVRFLERLHRRNSFLIDSHHPLRETLMLQTGNTEPERAAFLNTQYRSATNLLIHKWEPVYEHEPAF